MLTDAITECLLPTDRPRAGAILKSQPSDFFVCEQLHWTFKGEGEHIFLWIEKQDANTQWVAKALAEFYQVPLKDIGYAGLKDRYAITQQYFSIRLPGVKPGSYDIPTHPNFRVLSHALHDKKLKRGQHQGNRFVIKLREIDGDSDAIDQQLQSFVHLGFPNFFDSQRFGYENKNLTRVSQWIAGDLRIKKRTEKSLLLSALRASVFNAQLAHRVQNATWHRPLSGDTMMLSGSQSFFQITEVDETIEARVTKMDIHPAGVLIGKNTDLNGLAVSETIKPYLQDNEKLAAFLSKNNLTQQYRPFRAALTNLTWQFNGHECEIAFELAKGSYATAFIKQIFAV